MCPIGHHVFGSVRKAVTNEGARQGRDQPADDRLGYLNVLAKTPG